MEAILVNGPINAARLSGSINGTNKTVYLFMDDHIDVKYQTHCDSIESLSLVQYIFKMFDKVDQKKYFDFFAEIKSSEFSYPEYPFKDKYIAEINKYVKNEYTSEKKLIPNMRYHYIDIRDFLKTHINDIIYNIEKIIDSMYVRSHVPQVDYNNFLAILKNLKNILKYIHNLFIINTNANKNGYTDTNDNNGIQLDIPKNVIQKINYFIHKILNKYNHPDILKKFSPIFDDIYSGFINMDNIIEKIFDLCTKSEEKLFLPNNELNIVSNDDYNYKRFYYGPDISFIKNFINKIDNLVDNLVFICMETFALIVDIFFLRRFLDKDYITSAIVYSGGAHSSLYIYTLVKYFGFNISHFSYSLIPDINELNKTIKKTDSYHDVDILFVPKIRIQCVNMTLFPQGFS